MSTFARTDGQGSTRIILPVGQSSCTLALGSGKDQFCGLDRVDGADLANNPTQTGAPGLADDAKHTVHVKVARTAAKLEITVNLDGKKLLTWSGSASDLSRPRDWGLTESSVLGVGTSQTKVTFYSLQLRMLSGKARMVAVDETRARQAEEGRQPDPGRGYIRLPRGGGGRGRGGGRG
jgi:hypothetical protein